MPWHSINYATIFVLNYATKPGILAPLSRQSLFGHPGPTFARITHFPITDAVCPANQRTSYRDNQRILLQAFQPILSFTDSPIPFRYNPSPSLLPSSLVLIVLRVWNRRGEEFAVSVIALDASHRPLSAKN